MRQGRRGERRRRQRRLAWFGLGWVGRQLRLRLRLHERQAPIASCQFIVDAPVRPAVACQVKSRVVFK